MATLLRTYFGWLNAVKRYGEKALEAAHRRELALSEQKEVSNGMLASIRLLTARPRIRAMDLLRREDHSTTRDSPARRARARSVRRHQRTLVRRLRVDLLGDLVGLFFDLGEQRSVEVAEGEPYALSVSVVYDATEGGSSARLSAERVAAQLRELFEEIYGEPGATTQIALDACEAMADTHLTLADLRRVGQWRLEYMSPRDDDRGDRRSVKSRRSGTGTHILKRVMCP